MNSIAFIDTEIDPRSLKILDIGGVRADGCTFHKASVRDFMRFLNGTRYICGHNVINHDIKYINREHFFSHHFYSPQNPTMHFLKMINFRQRMLITP